MNSQGQSQGLPHSLGQPETRQETHYNVVYQHLVANDTDIVGQLAYCLYKQSKQKYLREFQRLNGRRPTDAELRIHVNCAELPALDDYRDKATQVMAEVLAQAAQEKQDTLEEHFKNQLWNSSTGISLKPWPNGVGEASKDYCSEAQAAASATCSPHFWSYLSCLARPPARHKMSSPSVPKKTLYRGWPRSSV